MQTTIRNYFIFPLQVISLRNLKPWLTSPPTTLAIFTTSYYGRTTNHMSLGINFKP